MEFLVMKSVKVELLILPCHNAEPEQSEECRIRWHPRKNNEELLRKICFYEVVSSILVL